MSTSSDSQCPLERYGFRGLHAVLQPEDSMREFVRRDEMALHLVQRGRIRILFAAGGAVTLPAGRLLVSWGAFPHRAEWLEPDTELYWVSLPLGWVLEWGLPSPLMQPLFKGRILIGPDGEEGRWDTERMQLWTEDLRRADDALNQIVLLEVRARLLRFALTCGNVPSTSDDDSLFHGHATLGRVLQFIAANLTQPLQVKQIAGATGLHPAYLSQLFKREIGIGPAAYLAQCRVAHAQALLLNTTRTIADIAERSGFGSTCQFHAVFRRHATCTPAQYRARHWPKG
ncbi:MAG: helix-turn-helix domain-containing protein [Lentisphaerae bacterium]|nr:helix-turn-helix domain-containing protein [Lentisphaerota bacterium]